MKIDDKYKWLARDKDGQLFAYEEKPSKTSEENWDVNFGILDEVDELIEGYNKYSFIKWKDDEPTSVGDLRMELANVKTMAEYADSNPINKPAHYIGINGIDVIGFAEDQFSDEELKGFYRINAIKYLTRYDKKGTPEEDLQKADFYLRKLIELNRS